MARKALRVKQSRFEKKMFDALKKGKKVTNITKHYNRCKTCGRTRSYMREFWVCRICFRRYAREGLIMWVRKASW